MKKLALVFVLGIILTFASASVTLAETVHVMINGDLISFPDAQPYINEDSRTLVPVRFISEELGADVSWNEESQAVYVIYNQQTIIIPIGKKLAYVEGNEIPLDTAAVVENDRTMVPVRFISEAMGERVLYNSSLKTVRISTIYDLSSAESKNNKYTSAPPMTINRQKQYSALIETNRGSFTMELFAEEAPITVNNFIFLARDGFFDGISFHRIMKGFMIQTGDPMGNGTGGPGYKFADELPVAEPYAPGIVAMANAGPNTNGSQFFICNGDNAAFLNNQPNYTVFGRITEGMDIIQKISDTPVKANALGEISHPMENVIIQHIAISTNE